MFVLERVVRQLSSEKVFFDSYDRLLSDLNNLQIKSDSEFTIVMAYKKEFTSDI